MGENIKNSFLSQFISHRRHTDWHPVKPALAVTVEPFQFSPAEPLAFELSYFDIFLYSSRTALSSSSVLQISSP
jgi:hypothetical protein